MAQGDTSAIGALTIVRSDQAAGTLLFASTPRDRRARRSTDVVLAVVSGFGMLIASVMSKVGGNLDAAIGSALGAFPSFLDTIWNVLAWSAPVWAGVILVAALMRHRAALAANILAACSIAVAVAVALSALVTDDAWAPLGALTDLDGPPTFPPGAIVLGAAAISVASPHLTRPFRHVGRWLVAGQSVALLFLGGSLPSGATAAIFVGLLAASVVHLVVGSPGGRPTASRIVLALRELGVDVVELEPARMQREGTVRFAGADRVGPLDVKVYGRDAWDAQLLATVWRLVWYRGSQRAAAFSRVALVEHEAFATLLAERAGVRAPQLVTAGSAGQGDALVVVRAGGERIDDGIAAITDDALAGLLSNLCRLHEAGMAHHRLDLDRIVVHADGTLAFGDLSSASVAVTDADRRHDYAQAIAVMLVLTGEQRSFAASRRELGDDALLEVLPYLQEAAVPPGVRDALRVSGVDLDDVRDRTRALLGAEAQPLIKLRRVTWGSLINLALLAVAAIALVSTFSDMDLATFGEELRGASWWWLAFALLLAQVPRLPAAWSTMGSLAAPLPMGPLTALQFAICFVNLAVPSTAARVAINVRFFQRFGVSPAMAMTAGGIDAVSGFVVQIVLFLVLFALSDLDLELSTDVSDLSGLATVVLVAIAVVVVGGVIAFSVPAIRRRVLDAARQARAALGVLRSPGKLLQLFGGNLISQVLFAVAFAACVEAFHAELPLSELILINTVVSLFAGLLPVPGGIGVSEAGLTLGLTTAGLTTETALAVALAYRFASFYLPPIWGWACYRWLVSHRYL